MGAFWGLGRGMSGTEGERGSTNSPRIAAAALVAGLVLAGGGASALVLLDSVGDPPSSDCAYGDQYCTPSPYGYGGGPTTTVAPTPSPTEPGNLAGTEVKNGAAAPGFTG
jgi:hypothetical protein